MAKKLFIGFLTNMLVSNYSKNIYYPSFSANLLISGNQSLLTSEQVAKLNDMVQPLGKKDDIVHLNIGSEVMDWVEINSQNQPKKFLSGYKMNVNTTLSRGKDIDLSTAEIQQKFWENYNELSPFGVVKNWIKTVKNNTTFDNKKFNSNPSLYNSSNDEWVNWASFKTPDAPPSKIKVDLDKCQDIVDIKIYGGIGYKHLLANANQDKQSKISAEDIIDDIGLNEDSKKKLREKISVADKCYNDAKRNHLLSKDVHSNNDGIYCGERLSVHDSILSEIFANSDMAKPEEGKQPTFIMLGGRAGSGKTKFGKDGIAKVYNRENYIVLSADEIKKRLPEYKGFNSGELHEESWDILYKAMKLSIDKGLNVVLDGTMSDLKSSEDTLKKFADNGYNIEMYFMYLPRDKAAKRALLRFDYNDRYLPLEVLLNMKDNEQNFDELKKYASKWAIYSNDVGLDNEPILINFDGAELLETLFQKCITED